mgnify:CR=1 FL=1
MFLFCKRFYKINLDEKLRSDIGNVINEILNQPGEEE